METNKKILIIDDEVDLVQLIGFQFKAKGFEVQTAGDGQEALTKVHEFHPDLIILDINMPRMGGVEFYSKICGTNGRPLYPVLVLTARANIKELFQDLEIDSFMIKPFEIDQLVHEAEVVIKRRSQTSSKGKGGASSGTRKICIVEKDQKVFEQMTLMFLNAGYTVIPAKSGAEAIERMMKEVPDLALVNLGLPDIAGDIVIFRLSQMSKTMEVKFVLYLSHRAEREHQVMERISQKKGIMTIVEYKELNDILDVVRQLL